MVKERRAYTTEGVQPTPPTEELRVSQRPVVDLNSTLNAEYNRAGLYLNPQIFSDLAKISDDIHDTRRFSNDWNFKVLENERELNTRALINDTERTVKAKQDLDIAGYKGIFNADAATAIEEAKKRGEDTVPAIMALKEKYLKMADNLEGQSPYIGSNFRQYVENKSGELQVQGIYDDATLAENKAKLFVSRNGAVEASNIILGNKNLETALVDYARVAFPVLDSITDVDDEVAVNKNFNTMVLADAQRVFDAYKSGKYNLTKDMVQNYLKNSMAVYRHYDMKGPDSEEVERTISCFLTPESIKTLSGLLSKLDESQSKSFSVYAADSYKQMVGADKAAKGEFTSIPYYLSADPTTARRDMESATAQLMMDVGNGNESAIRQLYEIQNTYFTQVHPQVEIIDYAKKILATTGSADLAIRDIQDRINKVRTKLLSGNVEAIDELTWSNGDVVVNLGFPGDDPIFQDYLRRRGETGKQAKYNYYSSLVDNVQKMLDSAKDSDLLAMMNPEFASASDSVANYIGDYGHLVREDATTGSVFINQEAMAEGTALITQAMQTKRAAAGNSIISPASTRWLSVITNTANSKNTKQKAVYLQAVGQMLSRAGIPDTFVSYKNATASNEEKAIARQVSMWAYLDKAPGLSPFQSKILNMQIGGENPNPSLTDADILLKNRIANGKNGGALSDEIDWYLDKYNIPADFRPTLRHTITQMAVASISGDATGNARFDANNIDNLLSSNFSKKGTYRYSTALNGVPVDKVDEQIDAVTSRTQHAIDTMGMKGKVTTQMDYESGMIKLYVDGKPLTGTGTYSKLSGTGIYPFGIAVAGMKPADMPEQKFIDAQNTLISTAVLASGLTSVDTNMQLQKAIKKLSPNMSNADVQKMSYKFLNVLADPEIQREYYAWYNSNYQNTRVVSAPEEFRNLMVDTLVSNAAKATTGNMLLQGLSQSVTAMTGAGGFGRVVSGVVSDKVTAKEREKVRQDQFGHMVDFLYTRMQDGNTMRVDVSQSAHFESKGFPFFNVETQVRNCGNGWIVTSATEGKHATNSLHYKGMAIDIGQEGGFWNAINSAWNRLDERKFQALWDGFILPNVKNGNIKRIGTSLPELVGISASSGYLKKYATMKNKDGEPLFVYMKDHSDHFHVEFNNQMYDLGTKKPYGQDPQEWALQASNTIYTNLNDKGSFGYVSREEAKAGAILWYNYTPTEWDVNSTGRSKQELTANPILRAQTAVSKMTRAKNATGSANLAIAGMYGARFKLQPINPSLKAPDKTFTIEEVIDMASRGVTSEEYRWMIADTRNANRYNRAVENFIKAGR